MDGERSAGRNGAGAVDRRLPALPVLRLLVVTPGRIASTQIFDLVFQGLAEQGAIEVTGADHGAADQRPERVLHVGPAVACGVDVAQRQVDGIVGRHFDDRLVLRVARALELAQPFPVLSYAS